MIFYLDEVVTNTNLITYNDGLNYGRFDAPDLKIHEYRIEISREDFIREIQAKFWDCLCEMRKDDKATVKIHLSNGVVLASIKNIRISA